ncbi:hypothetical protein CO989_24430 [Escherichia coli]|nr:hypothetical protein CO989_24430 [Escherichia coli]PCG47205.1 hypothetical protein CO991_24615 [Escherichia coli]PCG52657.1 hypothetical protein CO990_24595 [Escherichia coli]TGF47243.1 hypothetical protein DAH38_25045 [Escherichia coli]TJR50824.1 hypothetical protein C9Z36_24570 [Escherichia coli]
MHSSFGLPYPAGHWFYSLNDLLDNSVFMVCFLSFWMITIHFLLRAIYRKISETVEMVIIILSGILMILSFYLCAILKASL